MAQDIKSIQISTSQSGFRILGKQIRFSTMLMKLQSSPKRLSWKVPAQGPLTFGAWANKFVITSSKQWTTANKFWQGNLISELRSWNILVNVHASTVEVRRFSKKILSYNSPWKEKYYIVRCLCSIWKCYPKEIFSDQNCAILKSYTTNHLIRMPCKNSLNVLGKVYHDEYLVNHSP